MYTHFDIAVWSHVTPRVLVHAAATAAVLDPQARAELREADLRACLAAVAQPYSVCCTSRRGDHAARDRFCLSWPAADDPQPVLRLFVYPCEGRRGATTLYRVPDGPDGLVDLVRGVLRQLPELAAAAPDPAS